MIFIVLVFVSFLKVMIINSFFKYRLVFFFSYIVICFLLLFLDEISCFVIIEMLGEKIIFYKIEKKLNIFGGKIFIEILKIFKKRFFV